jgi:hypothetical protein
MRKIIQLIGSTLIVIGTIQLWFYFASGQFSNQFSNAVAEYQSERARAAYEARCDEYARRPPKRPDC